MTIKVWVIGLVFVCALMGALGQLLFKLGSTSVSLSLSSWITNWRIIFGMLIYGVSAILFIFALKHGSLSVLYPVVASSYIWVAILSAKFLGEPLFLTKWIGIVLIIGGVILIVLK